MGILLALLKIFAVLAGVMVLLIALVLLLPLGFAVEYRTGHLRVWAVYGPLRRIIWSHRLRWPKLHIQPPLAKGTAEATQPATQAEIPSPEPAAARQEARSSVPDSSSEPAEKGTQEMPRTESVKESVPTKVPEEEEELESGAIMGRLERIVELAVEEPKALAHCVLGHMQWLRKHSLFKIHVRHLYVFWTVTGEDAARTAIAYGAEMAAFNAGLSLLQQAVLLQSDRLWLEPDFLGTRRGERKISCTVSASAILMFHLLYRIWKDPLLQPVQSSEPQTI